MRRVIPITEQFQHFVTELKESFWGDVYGRTRLSWHKFLQDDSARERDQLGGASAGEEGTGSSGRMFSMPSLLRECHGVSLQAVSR